MDDSGQNKSVDNVSNYDEREEFTESSGAFENSFLSYPEGSIVAIKSPRQPTEDDGEQGSPTGTTFGDSLSRFSWAPSPRLEGSPAILRSSPISYVVEKDFLKEDEYANPISAETLGIDVGLPKPETDDELKHPPAKKAEKDYENDGDDDSIRYPEGSTIAIKSPSFSEEKEVILKESRDHYIAPVFGTMASETFADELKNARSRSCLAEETNSGRGERSNAGAKYSGLRRPRKERLETPGPDLMSRFSNYSDDKDVTGSPTIATEVQGRFDGTVSDHLGRMEESEGVIIAAAHQARLKRPSKAQIVPVEYKNVKFLGTGGSIAKVSQVLGADYEALKREQGGLPIRSQSLNPRGQAAQYLHHSKSDPKDATIPPLPVTPPKSSLKPGEGNLNAKLSLIDALRSNPTGYDQDADSVLIRRTNTAPAKSRKATAFNGAQPLDVQGNRRLRPNYVITPYPRADGSGRGRKGTKGTYLEEELSNAADTAYGENSRGRFEDGEDFIEAHSGREEDKESERKIARDAYENGEAQSVNPVPGGDRNFSAEEGQTAYRKFRNRSSWANRFSFSILAPPKVNPPPERGIPPLPLTKTSTEQSSTRKPSQAIPHRISSAKQYIIVPVVLHSHLNQSSYSKISIPLIRKPPPHIFTHGPLADRLSSASRRHRHSRLGSEPGVDTKDVWQEVSKEYTRIRGGGRVRFGSTGLAGVRVKVIRGNFTPTMALAGNDEEIATQGRDFGFFPLGTDGTLSKTEGYEGIESIFRNVIRANASRHRAFNRHRPSNDDIEMEHVWLHLIESLSTRKLLFAIALVVTTALTATLLWIFIGVGGKVLSPGRTGTLGLEDIGFRGAGGRVETGTILGIWVLLAGTVGVGGWLFIGWSRL